MNLQIPLRIYTRRRAREREIIVKLDGWLGSFLNFHDTLIRIVVIKHFLHVPQKCSSLLVDNKVEEISPARIYICICMRVAEAYLQPRFTPGSLEESKLSRIQHRNQILVKLLVEIISLLLAHVSRNTLGGLPRVTEYFATMRAIVLHGWRFATFTRSRFIKGYPVRSRRRSKPRRWFFLRAMLLATSKGAITRPVMEVFNRLTFDPKARGTGTRLLNEIATGRRHFFLLFQATRIPSSACTRRLRETLVSANHSATVSSARPTSISLVLVVKSNYKKAWIG